VGGSEPNVVALIAGAGSGRRIGGVPKQYRLLGALPLIVRSAWVFERHPRIASLIVVAPRGDVDRVQTLFRDVGFEKVQDVVAGGANRSESVANGLAVLVRQAEIVVVHDAVRPFVAPADVDAVIEAALSHGAASLALGVSDTLRNRSDGCFGEDIDRAMAVRVQTPQAFRAEVLKRAHADSEDVRAEATDDAALVMGVGIPVRIVPGSSFNFKITTPDDWMLARAIWPRWKKMQRIE